MKNKKPFVSVVLVTFNGLEVLKKCLPSFMKIEYPADRHEIILVDNASSDDTVNYIKKHFPKIKLVRNTTNLGYVAINSAIPHCKGDFIYFTNNDVEINPGLVKNMVNVLLNDISVAMVTQTTINYYNHRLVSGGTWVSRSMYCGHKRKTENFDIIEAPYHGGGMIRKSIIKKFGCIFDPDYFIYAEDLDLGMRIRLLGMKTVQISKAINYHMHSVTTMKYFTKYRNTFLLERNLLMTFFKVFSVKTIAVLLPYVLLMRLLTILRDLITFRPKIAVARIMAVLWIVINLRKIAKKRRILQRLRVADDSYILRIFSEKYLFKKPFLV